MRSDTTPDLAPELLTLREAAKLCNVSERTFWGWCHDGTAPSALRIGKGTVRHSRRVLEQWLAGGCHPVKGGRTDECN